MFIDEGAALGPKYCSTNIPPRTTSTSNHMTVQFVSDTSVSSIGFDARYITYDASELCGGEVTSPSGELTSPGYPENYPNSRTCVWLINAPQNQQIQGQFNDFDIEVRDVEGTCRDYVEVRNGNQANSSLIGTFCGSQSPPSFTSTHNHLYIKFHSDSSVQRRGFRLAYDATLEGCGGTLIGVSGELHSPNYPFAYNHQADCQYLIQTSAGSGLNITFLDLSLEGTGTTCSFDWVQVFDGPTTGSTPITPRLCGNNIPTRPLLTSGYQALVEFRSDASINGRGWNLVWETDFNRTIYYPHNGLVQSPNYPYLYPNNIEAQWLIVGTLGSTISFQFNSINIEGCTARCGCDSLEIFDFGTSDPDNSLLKACGTTIPGQVQTTDSLGLILFQTDSINQASGFELQYNINSCGNIFTAAEGTISSGYPDPDRTIAECFYLITIEPGKKIRLNIRELSLPTPNCDASYLKIYNGEMPVEQALLATKCSSSTDQLESSGAEMLLAYKTDTQSNKFRVRSSLSFKYKLLRVLG